MIQRPKYVWDYGIVNIISYHVETLRTHANLLRLK